MLSESRRLYNYFVRKEYEGGVLNFYDLLKDAVSSTLNLNGVDIDSYISVNSQRTWNYLVKEQKKDSDKNGIYPIFTIEDEYFKRISFYCDDGRKNRMFNHLIKARSKIIKKIDLLNDRDYEALACFVCKLLSSNNIKLTPKGNEKGVDFFATINFSKEAHYFFGINGPLRIIGQCKKHSSPVNVDHIKSFIETLNNIYRISHDTKDLIPTWFREAKGPIIGWIIGHEDFQTGAKSMAKNFGIIASTSRNLADIISLSKKYKPLLNSTERSQQLENEISSIFLDREINMELVLAD